MLGKYILKCMVSRKRSRDQCLTHKCMLYSRGDQLLLAIVGVSYSIVVESMQNVTYFQLGN